jgi:hypothetical protein
MYKNLAIVFQILAIENLKNHFILAFTIFTFTFGEIFPKKKKKH